MTERRRGYLSLSYQQLEELLGLSGGSIRSVNVSFSREDLDIIHDDEKSTCWNLVLHGESPRSRVSAYVQHDVLLRKEVEQAPSHEAIAEAVFGSYLFPDYEKGYAHSLCHRVGSSVVSNLDRIYDAISERLDELATKAEDPTE